MDKEVAELFANQSYNALLGNLPKLMTGAEMSDEAQDASNEDKLVDAMSAVAIVVIPVIAVVYWLSGMPTS